MSVLVGEAERRFLVFAHASALLGLLLPLGHLLGPYLVYLLAPPDAVRVRRQAADSMDFQLNVFVLLMSLLAFLLWVQGGWWFFVLFVPNLFGFGMAVAGATKAARGGDPRYPIAFRVLGRAAARDESGELSAR